MSANGMIVDAAFKKSLQEKRVAAVDILEDTGIKHRIMEATLRYEKDDFIIHLGKVTETGNLET